MKVIFDKKLYPFVKKALIKSFKKWECSLCGDKLSEKNFAGVIAKKLMCNNIVCLVEMVEDKRASQRVKELDKKIVFLKNLVKALYAKTVVNKKGVVEVKLTTGQLRDLIQAEKSILELENYIEDNY